MIARLQLCSFVLLMSLFCVPDSLCSAIAQIQNTQSKSKANRAKKQQELNANSQDLLLRQIQVEVVTTLTDGETPKKDEVIKIESRLASQITKASPCPPERLLYYGWVIPPKKKPSKKAAKEQSKEQPKEQPSPFIGWRGVIIQTKKVGSDWLVQVAVSPIYSHGGVTIGGNPYVETYRCSKISVVFQSVSIPTEMNKPKIMTFH